MSAIDARLKELGITLPAAAAPVANYVPCHIIGDLLFVSGQVSRTPDGKVMAGKLGAGVSVADGQVAARSCALSILAQAKAALGSLDRIVQVVKLTGFVNAAPTFTDHPQVVNGCSDCLVQVLGDKGRHTRSAVGMGSLPLDAAVEVEAIIQIRK
ncbi:MAG TPA: RidA family protein [Hyphomicrobiaceae bacterium]|nr:RidA family protein [Hyphomicrobiaceae bacterium]